MALVQLGGLSPGGGGVRRVSVLPDPAKPGTIVYVKETYQPRFSDQSVDLALNGANLGGGDSGFVSEAVAAVAVDNELRRAVGAFPAAGDIIGAMWYAYSSGGGSTTRTYRVLSNKPVAAIVVEGNYYATYDPGWVPIAGFRYYIVNELNVPEDMLGPTTVRVEFTDGTWLDAGDGPEVPEGYYHVDPETGQWVEGFGTASGGLPAAWLPEAGLSDADVRAHKWKGLLVGLAREDAGADWRLESAAGQEPVAAHADISNAAGTATLRITLDPSEAAGAAGNNYNVSTTRSSSGTVRIDKDGPSTGKTGTVRIWVVNLTFTQVAALVNAVAGLSAQVTVGDGSQAFPAPQGREGLYDFAGGVDGADVGAEVDEPTKTITLEHTTAHTQAEVLEALDGLNVDSDTALYAVLIAGSSPAANLAAAPQSRPFAEVFIHGSLPRHSADDLAALRREFEAYAPPANSITPPMTLAGNDAQRKAWRDRFHSPRISSGNTLYPIAEASKDDVRVITQDVARGLAFIDISDPSTEQNAADAGDVMMVLLFRDLTWTRVGNILEGSHALRARIDALRTLPEFPAAGSRTGKILKFAGDDLGWGTDEAGSGTGGSGADATARAAAAAAHARADEAYTLGSNAGILAQTAHDDASTADGKAVAANQAAQAAQLEADTVIEVGPEFVHNERAARNLNVHVRHPLNAYSMARLMSVAVSGQPPVYVEYDHTVLEQWVDAEVGETVLQNIWDQTVSTGSPPRPQLYRVGTYIPVEIRLLTGRNGDTVFIRVVDVLVVAAGVARKLTRKAAVAGAARTWTYTLDAADSELVIGGEIPDDDTPSIKAITPRTFPRGMFGAAARYGILDSRVPGNHDIPDASTMGFSATIVGNTLTLNTTGWLDVVAPEVWSR